MATAGEDGVVCLWQVMERARRDEDRVLNFDPSCVYFAMKDSSELAPPFVDKEKMGKFRSTVQLVSFCPRSTSGC